MNTDLIIQGTTIAFIAVAVLGFIRGFFKGTFRSLTDILFVIFSAAISVLASGTIAKTVTNAQEISTALDSVKASLGDQAMVDIINQVQGYLATGEGMSKTVSLVMALMTVIIIPIVFTVVYLIVGALLKIPKLLVPKTKNIGLKLLGGAFGAIRYVLAVAIFLVPLVGFLNYACDTIDAIQEIQVADAEEGSGASGIKSNEYVSMAYEIKDSGPVRAVYISGGKWLFKTLTTVDVEGTTVSLTDETQSIIGIYTSAKPLLTTPLIFYGDDQIEALDSVVNRINDSQFLTSLLANVISTASSELVENGEIFGYAKPDLGETFNPLFDRLLKVLANTSRENLVGDIRTLTNVISHSIEHGVVRECMLGENKDILGKLQNDVYLGSVLKELYKNERTRPMLPIISAFATNYVYDVYDEINNTTTPDAEEIKLENVTEDDAYGEGQRIAYTITEIKAFIDSIEKGEEVDVLTIVKNSDFAALGRGMNHIRDSMLLGDLYHFLISAVLHSEACAQLGIFDEDFIENASKPDADMEAMLVSRQNLVILTEAMWHGNSSSQAEALEKIINSMMLDDGDALKKLVTTENLESFGITGDRAETISGILVSVIDSVNSQEFESEEEKLAEVEKTGAIITAINNSKENTHAENTFSTVDSTDSKTGKSAEQFVEEVLDSKLASQMVEKATTTEDGETIDDPYKIHSTMSEQDDESLKNAILDKYSSEDTTDGEKQTLKAIAHIFGVNLGID